MKNLISIEPIAVKNKEEVVKALTILEKIGINIMTEEKKKTYLEDTSKTVDNNFMVQEADGGFRIQSHYLGNGISIESLEHQVDKIVEKYPQLAERIKAIEEKKTELTKEIEENSIKIKELYSSADQIKIKEKP